MNDKPIRSEGEPHDRLTRICDAMSDAMRAHPEYRDGDRAILMVDDEDRGGLMSVGYEHDWEAAAAALEHLRALHEANGIPFEVHAIRRGHG